MRPFLGAKLMIYLVAKFLYFTPKKKGVRMNWKKNHVFPKKKIATFEKSKFEKEKEKKKKTLI